MRIEQIDYFLAVVSQGSFTRAAKACFVSQTAISQQIALLENELGAPLFLRRHHGAQLTRAGEALLPAAYKVRDSWKEMEAVAERLGRREKRISVAYVGPWEQELLVRAILLFQQDHPDIAVEYNQCNFNEIGRSIKDRSCDIALSISGQVAAKHCRVQTIGCQKMRLAICANSPSVGQGAQISMGEMLKHPIVIVDQGFAAASGDIRVWLRATGFPEDKIITVNTINEQLLMVATGRGIAYLPESIRWPGICTLDLPDAFKLNCSIAAYYWHESGAVAQLVALLKKVGKAPEV